MYKSKNMAKYEQNGGHFEKMAATATRGQIQDVHTIKSTQYTLVYLYAKVHAFITMCTIYLLFCTYLPDY